MIVCKARKSRSSPGFFYFVAIDKSHRKRAKTVKDMDVFYDRRMRIRFRGFDGAYQIIKINYREVSYGRSS